MLRCHIETCPSKEVVSLVGRSRNLVQIVGAEVRERGERVGNRHGLGHGSRSGRGGGNGLGARRGAREQIGGELVLSVVHEVLDELEVLGLELLARGLEAVDLGKLVLLLGERLANDLARLRIGLGADAVGVLARLGDDVVGGLLGGDEGRGDLAGGRGVLRARSGGGSRRGRRGRSGLGLLHLGLGGSELLLGGGQAGLEVDDLVEHGVDLGGEPLEEDIDLGRIVAALGLGEGLRLNVSGSNGHDVILSYARCTAWMR